MKAIVVDGKEVLRGSFRSCMGVAVLIEDIDFYQTYDNLMSQPCQKYAVPRVSKVLNSYQILHSMGLGEGKRVLEDFFVGLKHVIKGFTIYNTLFSVATHGTIGIYGHRGTPSEQIHVIEFLKKLAPTYPHCCAWKYLQQHPEACDIPVLVDFFEGETTSAWIDLQRRSNVSIYARGDECNPYISTADLLTKLTDLRLSAQSLRVSKQDILAAYLDFPVMSEYLGDLGMIRMLDHDPIDTSPRLAHPVVYVLKEGVAQYGLGGTKEHDVIEASPAMPKIRDLAYDKRGCFKFFDAGKDQKDIRPGDIFVYFGENGKKLGEYFVKLGYPIELRDIAELR